MNNSTLLATIKSNSVFRDIQFLDALCVSFEARA